MGIIESPKQDELKEIRTKTQLKWQQLKRDSRQKKKRKKEIPFKITSKNKVKYLGIYLTKEMKNLYSENYNILMKETVDYSRK